MIVSVSIQILRVEDSGILKDNGKIYDSDCPRNYLIKIGSDNDVMSFICTKCNVLHYKILYYNPNIDKLDFYYLSHRKKSLKQIFILNYNISYKFRGFNNSI